MQVETTRPEVHERLSVAYCKLVELADGWPEIAAWSAWEELQGAAASLYSEKLQPWPSLIDARRLRLQQRACRELSRLVRELPRRVFDNDSDALRDFYGLDRAQTELVAASLRSLPDMEHVVGRGDYIDTVDGLRCLELNMVPNLGGWESAILAARYGAMPLFGELLERLGVEVTFRNSLEMMLKHVLEIYSRRGGHEPCHVALLADERVPIRTLALVQRFVDGCYRSLQTGTTNPGQVVFCHYSSLEERDGLLFLGEQRIGAVLEQFPLDFDAKILPCIERGEVLFVNGPIKTILTDKRNLALLSDPENDDLWTTEERETIRSFIPWTRVLRPGSTIFEGRRVDLIELVARRREDMVLKAGQGQSGEAVLVGRFCPQARWLRRVEEAVAAGDWLVQERLESLPFLFPSEDGGLSAYEVVWGFFSAGDRYCGGFGRMAPRGQQAAINTSRGALESFLFEVVEG